MDQKVDIASLVRELGVAARAAARELARASTETKNHALAAIAAALCIKAGNACILRGGSEALESNRAIAACVRAGLKGARLPEAAVKLVGIADRAAVGAMVRLREYIDIIVPRGGKELIERLIRESQIPMIKHLDGVCHVYVDDEADAEMAVRIADNAKTQRYGTCNTMETLLVAEGIAATVLPRIARVYQAKGVEMRAARWAWKASRRRSSSCSGTARFAPESEVFPLKLASSAARSIRCTTRISPSREPRCRAWASPKCCGSRPASPATARRRWRAPSTA